MSNDYRNKGSNVRQALEGVSTWGQDADNMAWLARENGDDKIRAKMFGDRALSSGWRARQDADWLRENMKKKDTSKGAPTHDDEKIKAQLRAQALRKAR